MRNRLFVIVSVIVMVGVLLAGWFLGVSPQLSAAADDDVQRTTVDGQNEALRLVVAQLVTDEKDLPTWKKQLEGLQRSIPRGSDTSAFIGDINGIAVAAGVTVSSITVADAQQYLPPVPVSAPVVAAEEAPPSDEAAVEPTTEAAVDPLVPSAFVSPLVTTENFVLVPVTVESKGAYDQILNFVSGLQSGDRLFLVTNFRSSTSAEDGTTTGTITGYIYVLLNQFDPTAAK